MQYLVYVIVLLISAGSVLFGVEWMQAPMSPMPTSSYELRAARPPAPPVVQQAAAKPADAKSESGPEAKPEVAGAKPVEAAAKADPAPAAAAAPVAAVTPPEPAPLVAPEPPSLLAETPAAPLCDVQACERAYRTFTASDCTYQPSGDGPRRLCTRGTPPAVSAPRTDARAQATCNIAACSNAYVSFNASDCTYQPVDGPRRICEK